MRLPPISELFRDIAPLPPTPAAAAPAFHAPREPLPAGSPAPDEVNAALALFAPPPPAPPLRPPVWSATRQEICEGSKYFRSYQGGTYPVPLPFDPAREDPAAPGAERVPVWLIDSTTSIANADVFTGNVLISHTGGHFDPSSGAMKSSQSEKDPSRRLFLDAYRNGTPVLPIFGTRYECPLDWDRLAGGLPAGTGPRGVADGMKPRYVVMGWAKITDYWIEPEPALPEGKKAPKTGRRSRVPEKPGKEAKGEIKADVAVKIEQPDNLAAPTADPAIKLEPMDPGDASTVDSMPPESHLPSPPPSDDLPPAPDSPAPGPRTALRYKFRAEFIRTGSPDTDRSVAGRWWPHLVMQRVDPDGSVRSYMDGGPAAIEGPVERGALPNRANGEDVEEYLDVVDGQVVVRTRPRHAPPTPISPEAADRKRKRRASNPPTPPQTLRYVMSDGTAPRLVQAAMPTAWNPDWEPYLATSAKPVEACHLCGWKGPRRWEEGWMCGNLDCEAWWKLRTLDASLQPPAYVLFPPPTQLHYHPTFLLPVLEPDDLFTPPFPILPAPPPAYSPPGTFDRTAFHCRTCGRISCSRSWTGWTCLGCGRTAAIARPVGDVSTAWTGQGRVAGDGSLGKPDAGHVLGISSGFLPDGRRETVYAFPNGCTVEHRRAHGTPLVDRADEVFRDLQLHGSLGPENGGIGFERRVLKQSPLGKGTVTSHYSVNFGEEYGHSYFMEPSPFHLSTLPALAFLSSESRVDFNEMLIALYARSSKMDWHDDGEPGVQGTVATWSMGSPCVMSFRSKHKPRGAKADVGEGGGKVLRILLLHGDVLIMRGAELQSRYDHRVDPEGFRMACTARRIILPAKQGAA
ncbi:hypothetical protein DFJ74DRAFT_745481 [Hyaloraphidium curvatum]|nr:hypothetical protein DFJ74DRAFT_745481 [Hyaloraphidium curvatum]